MKSLVALLMLITLGIFRPSEKGCSCFPVAPDEHTRWGGNHWIAYKQDGVYRSISGKVVNWSDEKNLEDALVEVFDKPDYLLCEWKEHNPNKCTIRPPELQRRVAACTTGKDGRYCFSDIPAGVYELRVSKDGQWNVVHAHVVVDPNGRPGRGRGIIVKMSLGD